MCVCVWGGDLLSHKQKQRESQEACTPEVRGNGPDGGASEFGRLDTGVVTNAQSLEQDRNRPVRLWRTCLTFLSLSSLSITKDSSYRILLL